MFRLTLTLLPLLLASDPPASASSAATLETPPATPDARAAPEPITPANAPSEGELTPPPDTELAAPSPGFVEIRNPAFPTPSPKAVEVDRGRKYEASDFTPYFATGALAQAKAAYDLGKFSRALQLLNGQGNAPPVRYLRSLLQLKTGDYASAAAGMESLLKDYPAMRDRCLAHAALANEQKGNWKAAEELYAAIPTTSRLYPDALFGLSRARRRQGNLAGAGEALKPLTTLSGPMWGRDDAAEALMTQADLAHARHDTAAEQKALLSLWGRHPLSTMAKHAERRLNMGAIPKEAQVERAESLIELHRNKDGMKILTPLLTKLALPDPLACRAHFAFGKALRKERSHTKAEAELIPVVSKCTAPDLRARALYVLGSSQSIVNMPKGAETYETLARDYPAHPFADDALFFAADLYAKRGDLNTALQRLGALAGAYPSGDFFSEALFKSFWIRRGRGEKPAAYAMLDRIDRELGDSDEQYDVERARYWRARMAETENRPQEAASLYEKLALEHRATYYGILSRGRLKALDTTRAEKVMGELNHLPARSTPWPLYASSVGEDAHFRAGVELLRMGFGDAASNELLAVNRSGKPAESIRLLVQALALAGDSQNAHSIARVSLRRDLGGPMRPETRSLWELAYPDAFRPAIEKYCKKVTLDPDLLQALMREESALDPKALSWAGALGLTQLMLPTAKGVAKQLHLKERITQEALLQPELNIQLGAAYLGQLVNRFQGVLPYALAGYNAGALMVDRWRGDKRSLELDEWVEEIPIAETRGYVKRVLRTYNTYQLLHGKPTFLTIQGPTLQARAAEGR